MNAIINTNTQAKLQQLLTYTMLPENHRELEDFAEEIIRFVIDEVTSGHGSMNKKADIAIQLRREALYNFFNEGELR